MRTGSLRLRLFAAGAAAVTLALAIAAVALFLLFERHVERRTVAELESHLRQMVAGIALGPDGSLAMAHPPAEPRFTEPLGGLYWQVAVQPDGPTLRSRSLWDASLALESDPLPAGEVHRHTVPGPDAAPLLVVERQVVLPPSLGGRTIRAAVAVTRAEIRAASWAFAADLAPSLVLLGAFLAVAGWVQVDVGLRPLDAVRRRLAAVRSGTASRLGDAFPDEVRPLAGEVDTLLEAQEKAVARARARAGDLAHGLKTPLTVLAADAEELRARGEIAMADEIAMLSAGMRRHIERELARARAGHRTAGRASPLRSTIERVVDVLRRTPDGGRIAWSIEVAPDVVSTLDTQDLAEMIGNVAENAAQWAASRVRIHGARAEGAHAEETYVLSVEDDGPGIPEEEAGTVLARGGRLDESKPGSGLGLAIVSDLAEALGGEVSLARSPLGGLRVDLRLPRTA